MDNQKFESYNMGIGHNIEKPMLDTMGQIQHLKNKGITFHYYSEEQAFDYLRHNDNYFKIASYRKNYDKYQGGENEGKYIALDFGYLKDLAIVDMRLRYTLVQLALDIEHYAKIDLLTTAEAHREDGYTICEDFFISLSEKQMNMINHEIERNKNSIYCGDLFKKYPEHFPVWVFLEMIPFGRMVSFYKFCAERYDSDAMRDRHFLLKTCKEIRNASAHSSCILNDLRSGSKTYNSRYTVMKELSKIKGISKAMRSKRMSNARMQQIVTLLYTHNQIVTSEGVHDTARKMLQEFSRRMYKNIDYYKTNDLITANFYFLKTVIDSWYEK